MVCGCNNHDRKDIAPSYDGTINLNINGRKENSPMYFHLTRFGLD